MPQVPVYYALDPGDAAAAFICPLALVQVPHLQFLGRFNIPRPILPKAPASDFNTPPRRVITGIQKQRRAKKGLISTGIQNSH